MAKGHGERLSRDQEKAIASLLVAPTVSDAADRVGVHPNTLRAWMRQPAFASAYAEVRQELLSRTIGRLQHALFAVADALVKDLTHKLPAVRHRAAQLLLDAGLKGTEVLTLSQRVAELETLLRDGGLA